MLRKRNGNGDEVMLRCNMDFLAWHMKRLGIVGEIAKRNGGASLLPRPLLQCGCGYRSSVSTGAVPASSAAFLARSAARSAWIAA